jgi:putative FmdB family regulatory protein
MRVPKYEYRCTQCQHNFEVTQSFSDAAIEVCPECGGEVRKVYNNVGVVFKGSGFYRTDSRSSGNAGSSSTTSGGSSPSPTTPASSS